MRFFFNPDNFHCFEFSSFSQIEPWQLDQYVEVPKVFLNAGKGTPATKKDLLLAFKSENEEIALCTILLTGDLQVCRWTLPPLSP